jgi:hypothetical protein
MVSWPEEPSGLSQLAEGLAELSNWSGAALVLSRPGMPREAAVDDVCRIHGEFGYSSRPADVKAGPGHIFDADPVVNRATLKRLLVAVMSGYLEGRLVTKDGRFVAVFGCGVIDFHSADKGLSGRLRTLFKELRLSVH